MTNHGRSYSSFQNPKTVLVVTRSALVRHSATRSRWNALHVCRHFIGTSLHTSDNLYETMISVSPFQTVLFGPSKQISEQTQNNVNKNLERSSIKTPYLYKENEFCKTTSENANNRASKNQINNSKLPLEQLNHIIRKQSKKNFLNIKQRKTPQEFNRIIKRDQFKIKIQNHPGGTT